MSTLGQRIRKLRREKDWSQTQLAQKTGVHKRMISRYENGASDPSMDTLQKLADALGVSMDFLLADSPTKNLAAVRLHDTELLGYFEEIEKMDESERKALKAVIEAMILKSKMRAMIGKES